MFQRRKRRAAAILLAATLPLPAAPVATAQEGPGAAAAPAYARRGDQVEARHAAYEEHLRRVHEALRARLQAEAPDLSPILTAAPAPVRHGYGIVPRIVADSPPPATPPRARAASYSWPWTEQLIARDGDKLGRLEAELDGDPAPRAERRTVYGRLAADYARLAANEGTIDAHIQYNRLWQSAIARDRPGYDRGTVLEHAVLERQAIRDALASTDDEAFRKALASLSGIDPSRPRDALEGELRERDAALSRQIREATDQVTPPPFLRVEQPGAHTWVIRVPVYTDIADRHVLHAVEHAVQDVWRLRDGEDTFRVRLALTYVPAARLYGTRPVPREGEEIDLGNHVALFPPGGAVLTTGARWTHVTAGRCVALGPHDLAPHVLAHEFGHVLGFKDVYFRGYRDLGEDGFEVTEVVADPEDVMGDPGSGPVLRRHFEKLIGSGIPARSGP